MSGILVSCHLHFFFSTKMVSEAEGELVNRSQYGRSLKEEINRVALSILW